MDETDDLPSSPHAILRIPVKENLPTSLTADKRRDLGELTGLTLALDLQGLLGDAVAVQARGVAPPAQQERRVRLAGPHDGLLDGLVDGGLDGAEEARAHVDAAGAEAERRGEALPVGETAGGDEGDLECLPGPGEEDEVGDVGFADVAERISVSIQMWHVWEALGGVRE